MNYDLEERTARFGENVIVFVARLPKNDTNKILLNQIIRSAPIEINTLKHYLKI